VTDSQQDRHATTAKTTFTHSAAWVRIIKIITDDQVGHHCRWTGYTSLWVFKCDAGVYVDIAAASDAVVQKLT